MDCIEAMALKASLRSETTMKPISNTSSNNHHQVLVDDFYYTVDDFIIDDLLDLSNEDFTEQDQEGQDDGRGVENDDSTTRVSVKFNGFDDFENVPAGEFSVPIDDLEDLEWVSRVVHDSEPEMTLTPARGSVKIENAKKWSKPGSIQGLSVRLLCFPSAIPAKPRTKRARPTGRVWSLESPALSESSSSSTHSGSSSPTSCLMFHNFGKPPVKKQKKSPVLITLGDQQTGPPQFQRRCSHCQVQKTPQWRTGPLGAKTLCNACGVRFKSGRLCPEYRPACSPTFSSHIHSNSHRKVMEMRRVKETTEPELKPY